MTLYQALRAPPEIQTPPQPLAPQAPPASPTTRTSNQPPNYIPVPPTTFLPYPPVLLSARINGIAGGSTALGMSSAPMTTARVGAAGDPVSISTPTSDPSTPLIDTQGNESQSLTASSNPSTFKEYIKLKIQLQLQSLLQLTRQGWNLEIKAP